MKDNIFYSDKYLCPIIHTVELLSKKWIIPIICTLNNEKTLRYNQLRRSIPNINNVALSQSLKLLEQNHIVSRIQYNEVPLRVEYSLTLTGSYILPALYMFSKNELHTINNKEIKCTLNDCRCDFFNEFSNQIHVNDKTYLQAFRNFEFEDDFKNMSSIEKLKNFEKIVMKTITKDGKKNSTIIYKLIMNGTSLSEIVYDKRRPFHVISRTLVEEAIINKETNSKLSCDEILRSCYNFMDGLIQEWSISNEYYDIVERNQNIIDWFFDSLSNRQSN